MSAPPFRRLFRLPWRSRQQIHDEVEEEIRFHLDMRVEELTRSGLPPEAARRQALGEFGDLGEARWALIGADREIDAARHRTERLDGLRRDLRFAARALRRSPVFTAAAVLTVALAIGANTAVFSLVDGVLLRPLPYPDPDRLVALWEDHGGRGGPAREMFDPADFFALRERGESLVEVAAVTSGEIAFVGSGAARSLGDAIVSRGYFELFGARPVLGRFFVAADESFPEWTRVVVLSHGFWRREFGADPEVIGSSIALGGEPHTVVGVAPADFRPPGPPADVWRPMRSDPVGAFRDFHLLHVFGRLRPGASPEQARALLDALAASLAAERPESGSGVSFRVVSLREHLLAPVRPGMLMLWGAVGLVLLLACVNLAALLASRATARERETAVRAALGAGRGRIVRQLLTESLLVSLVGGALGVLVAFAGVDLLLRLVPPETPRLAEVAIDVRVLGFSGALTLFTSLAFGLLPAVRASRLDPLRGLGTSGAAPSGGRRRSARSALVAAEVAIALVLLVGAGLLTRSFARLMSVDAGFEVDNVLTIALDLNRPEYREPGATDAFFEGVFERLNASPGIETVGAVTFLPLGGGSQSAALRIEGEGPNARVEAPTAWYRHTRGNYFGAMGMRIVKGRGFTDGGPDSSAEQQVVINETLARRLFGASDPVGRRILPEWSRDQWFTIVGVVGDVRHEGLARRPVPELYFRNGRMSMSLVARTAADPLDAVPAVREAVWSVDPRVPLDRFLSMEQILGRSVAMPRLYLSLFVAFAAAALLLAVLGVYGVMSHAVALRTREIGVRMALGASRIRVLGLVLRDVLAMLASGLAVGLLAALLASRLLGGLLYGLSPTDPSTFLLVTLLLGTVALVAAALPARRATRVDPMIALRTD